MKIHSQQVITTLFSPPSCFCLPFCLSVCLLFVQIFSALFLTETQSNVLLLMWNTDTAPMLCNTNKQAYNILKALGSYVEIWITHAQVVGFFILKLSFRRNFKPLRSADGNECDLPVAAAGRFLVPLGNWYKDETGGRESNLYQHKTWNLILSPSFVRALSNGTGQVLSTILISFNCFLRATSQPQSPVACNSETSDRPIHAATFLNWYTFFHRIF
jgi:hypothetical protein